MADPAGRLPLTPSQTVGPFLHIALDWPDGPEGVPAIPVTATDVKGGGVTDLRPAPGLPWPAR